ncbi:MAG TPA: RNA polymerase sigma-70 factor [Cyclobacteriaceae bacterium]|nr:RNA polymerase sigma-70 factor [Cyclobacteriaceae bacterium]
MSSLPEDQIIKGIREGSEAHFRQVFDAYFDALCHYAFTKLRDMDEAEDIVQGMFVKVWEKRSSLVITQSIRSYLFRAVHNHCINQLEHRDVRQRHLTYKTSTTGNESQPPEVFPEELEDNIRNAIEQLPQQCRLIFKMSRYEELKYAEIADKLGISVNTVENQISKALKILRAQLSNIIV